MFSIFFGYVKGQFSYNAALIPYNIIESILEDFENASLYISYHLLKDYLKVKRMFKIIIVSCTSTR